MVDVVLYTLLWLRLCIIEKDVVAQYGTILVDVKSYDDFLSCRQVGRVSRNVMLYVIRLFEPILLYLYHGRSMFLGEVLPKFLGKFYLNRNC